MKKTKTFVLSTALLLASNVNADVKNLPADSSKVKDLDEVIVISQPKENLRLRVQAVSATMISDEQMQRLGVTDLRTLSPYIPSFSMPNYGSRVTSAMYIRGIGSRINSPAVGIYLDGMPIIGKSALNFHAYGMQRIDVLRGPQGTLYGQNTEGGLVRLYTKNPMDVQGTDIRLGIGTHFQRNAEAAHYRKVSDNFAFSVAGFYNGGDGFFKNQNNDTKADSYNEAGGRVRLVFRPARKWLVDYTADYQYVRQNAFPYGIVDENGNTADPNTTFQNNYRRNMFTTGLKITVEGNGFDFHSTSTYQYLKDYLKMDQDCLPQDFLRLTQRQLQNALTQEFVFKSRRKNVWDWTVGAFASYQWLQTKAPVGFGDGITTPIAQGIYHAMYNAMLNSFKGKFTGQGMTEEEALAAAKQMIEQRGGIKTDVSLAVPETFRTPQFNLGFFHESNIRITPRLTATLGLRYDYMRTKIDYQADAQMVMAATVMGKEAAYRLTSSVKDNLHNDYEQLLPKVGLTYRFSDNGSNVYATVGKGYRAGGYNIQMFSDILQTELNANASKAMRGDYDVPHTEADYDRIAKTISYRPEKSWNYEAGTRLNLFNQAVQLDFSAFYMQVHDLQLSVMAGNYGFGRMMVNAGKSYSCGIEASLRGNAFENSLQWGINYGYTHSAFKEYTDTVMVNGQKNAVDYKDKRVPFVPRHTLSAFADYRWELNKGILTALTFGANMYANGNIYWDEANTCEQKMFVVTGAHIDAQFGKAVVSLWGRNLTDSHYNTFVVKSGAAGKAFHFGQKGNPIQFGVDFRLRL